MSTQRKQTVEIIGPTGARLSVQMTREEINTAAKNLRQTIANLDAALKQSLAAAPVGVRLAGMFKDVRLCPSDESR